MESILRVEYELVRKDTSSKHLFIFLHSPLAFYGVLLIIDGEWKLLQV
jgi:hypothetical protein